MINHIRTLLLNRAAAELSDAGEAYIPPAYAAKELVGHASTVRAALFGTAPDKLMQNYRLYQLLKALRVSSLAALETQNDTRITYDALLAREFPDVFGFATVAPSADVAILNASTPAYNVDAAGITRHKLQLRVDITTVSWRWLSAARADLTSDKPAAQDGLLTVAVPLGQYAVTVPDTPGSTWMFDAAYRPTATLPDLEAALQDAGVAVTELINSGSRTAVLAAPYDQLLAAWVSPRTPFDRVSAAALALALRTAEI